MPASLALLLASPALGRSVLASWATVLRTQNLPPDRPADAVSRWLLITRASVLPMTAIAALVGGLLAVPQAGAAGGLYFLEALVGLLVAHASNNMINDWFDLRSGLDREGYVRADYAPHPILSGLISKRGLVAAIAVANLVDLAILGHLFAVRGWPVVAFALAGLFVSVFYVAPPLRLKHRGLGEPGVFVVWGPLMIAGTYYVTAGTLPAWVWAASLPYGVLVTTVLFAKHMDKLPADRERGIRTLPVILGAERARWATQSLIASFFVLVALLVLTGTFGVWTLAVFAALPRAIRVMGVLARPRPESAPPGFPIWPLWYVAWAFQLTRLAGLLLVAGLVADVAAPLRL